jgi:hypothetical protein
MGANQRPGGGKRREGARFGTVRRGFRRGSLNEFFLNDDEREFRMFEKLNELTSKSTKKSAPKSALNIPSLTKFVLELAKAGHRISYGALADAGVMLGEPGTTSLNMSNGQRGAKLVLHLPAQLQPYVCQAGGGYRKGTAWEGVEVRADLRQLPFVRPEAVGAFVREFKGDAAPVVQPQAAGLTLADLEPVAETIEPVIEPVATVGLTLADLEEVEDEVDGEAGIAELEAIEAEVAAENAEEADTA